MTPKEEELSENQANKVRELNLIHGVFDDDIHDSGKISLNLNQEILELKLDLRVTMIGKLVLLLMLMLERLRKNISRGIQMSKVV